MTSSARWFLVASMLLLALGGTSRAGYVVNFTETGGNVVATGRGTLNTTGLAFIYLGGPSWTPTVEADSGFALLGTPQAAIGQGFFIAQVVGPTSFGNGPRVAADSGTGDDIGIYRGYSPDTAAIYVSSNFVSGSMLHSSATWDGQTFASLGLTPGRYTYTWGSGANADFFTINIGLASVPEPSSLLLAVGGSGMVALAALARRRVK